MATKVDSVRKSPAKVSLRSHRPVKVTPTRVKITAMDDVWLSRWLGTELGDTPEPKGNPQRLTEALNMLGVKGEQRVAAEVDVRELATSFIARKDALKDLPSSRMRPKDAAAILEDVSTAANLLEARLKQLPAPLTTRLVHALGTTTAFQDNSTSGHLTLNYLERLAAVAQQLRALIPRDTGNRNQTLHRVFVDMEETPWEVDQTRSFIVQGVALFSRYKKSKNSTRGALRFVSAVHSYAIDRELGHEALFYEVMKARRVNIAKWNRWIEQRKTVSPP